MTNENFHLKVLGVEDNVNNNYFNEIYDYSFPYYEQRTLEGRRTILQRAPTFNAWVICFHGRNSGILGGWQVGKWFYIEHFAVDKSQRGLGIGKLAMDYINTKFKHVILEIDIPQDSISFKRLDFYKSSGYVINNISHVHPSYKVEYRPHSLEVLSFPRSLSNEEYEVFNCHLREIVMAKCYL